MEASVVKTGTQALRSLAREIQDEHLMCEQAAESAVEHAIKCGELLIEAKTQVKHGEWLPWLEANAPEHYGADSWARQAQKYMRLYDHRDELPNTNHGSHLGINAALAELAEPREVSNDPVEWTEIQRSEDDDLTAVPEPDEEPEPVEGEVVDPAVGPRKQGQQERLVQGIVKHARLIEELAPHIDLKAVAALNKQEATAQWEQQLRATRTILSQLIAAL